MEIQTSIDGFYEEIMARLTSLVSAIKHYDIYLGQYDNPEVDENGNPIYPAFNVPATFFEWPNEINWEPLALRRKKANINFGIHVVQKVIQEVDKRTTSSVRAKGHQHLSLINEIQIALEGFNGNQGGDYKFFGAISYVGLKPYAQVGEYTAHIMSFTVRLVNDAAKKYTTRLDALVPPITATDIINSEITPLDPEVI